MTEDRSTKTSRSTIVALSVIIVIGAIIYNSIRISPIKEHPQRPLSTETVYICLENHPSLDPDRIRVVCIKWVKGAESIQDLTNQYPIYGWITLPQENEDILLPK